MIIPSEHIFVKKDVSIGSQGSRSTGISIGDDVWIASGAKVLDGAGIENGCVIGANSLVKGNLPAYGVYAGVPAKLISCRT